MRMLYKASRDGFRPADFYRCCAEKGATLTLIQAGRTGNVFGAYTAVAWPKQSARGSPSLNVADPSGMSFMFSLTNEYDRPFRLSLADRTCAMRASSANGPMIGGEV